MKEITTEELKKIQTKLLEQIDEVCSKNGLEYAIIAGTLLGAVRHKGFIPWDDDIDIAMRRDDYERFIEYCKTHEMPFEFKCNKLDSKYGYLFGKVCDKQTTIVEKYGNRWKSEMGVYVDVFPIDTLASTQEESKKLFRKTRFKRELLVAANWRKYFRSKTAKWYIEPIRFAFFLLSRFVNPTKLINKIEKFYGKNSNPNASYSALICGAYREREIMETKVYNETIDYEFEGKDFKGLKNYHEYLSALYGDYMQLPPEEKRVTHHTYIAYYKD